MLFFVEAKWQDTLRGPHEVRSEKDGEAKEAELCSGSANRAFAHVNKDFS